MARSRPPAGLAARASSAHVDRPTGLSAWHDRAPSGSQLQRRYEVGSDLSLTVTGPIPPTFTRSFSDRSRLARAPTTIASRRRLPRRLHRFSRTRRSTAPGRAWLLGLTHETALGRLTRLVASMHRRAWWPSKPGERLENSREPRAQDSVASAG